MASKKLLQEAQSVMDLYFQDFAPADGFFSIEDFADWMGRTYAKFADETAKEIYKQYVVESGVGTIIFSPDWWASEEVEIQSKDGEFFAEIKFKHLGFTYDGQNSGVQEVIPVGKEGNCGTFMRTTITDVWITEGMSKNNIVWWYQAGDKLRFKTNSKCNPKKVMVYYIPTAEDDNFKLPTSKVFEIATTAYNVMIAAKKQTPFVDDTNNANKNILPETETDLKTRNPIN